MKPGWLTLVLLFGALGVGPLTAQKLAVDTYYITVVTKTGDRTQGIFTDVTQSAVVSTPALNSANVSRIPLETIEKVVLRRTNKRREVRSGAVVGGLSFGALTAVGLQRNPTSSPVTYGVTLLLGASTGAGVGAGVGWLLGNLSRRTIRPRPDDDGLDAFRRRLEPFSLRYQTDLFNRIHQ